MRPRRPIRIRRFLDSLQHALEGVLDVYRSQRHMRIHFAFMALNVVLAMVYKLSAIETALVMVCITLVVFAVTVTNEVKRYNVVRRTLARLVYRAMHRHSIPQAKLLSHGKPKAIKTLLWINP